MMYGLCFVVYFFFFKQKTAYEMRISDWSSDVCSSDLFVRVSIEHVVHTLFEAVVLVFLVMLLFLQNFRATLIPTIAVPVVLLGTFGVLAAFGYSVNTLTLFGMILAIGLLVDDAIEIGRAHV